MTAEARTQAEAASRTQAAYESVLNYDAEIIADLRAQVEVSMGYFRVEANFLHINSNFKFKTCILHQTHPESLLI